MNAPELVIRISLLSRVTSQFKFDNETILNTRRRLEHVPDFYVYRHLLEVKVQIVHILATSRHEGLDVKPRKVV